MLLAFTDAQLNSDQIHAVASLVGVVSLIYLEQFEMFFFFPLSPLVQPVSAVMSGITATPAQDSASAL